MGMPVVSVAAGGLPIVESTNWFSTPVTEAANGRGLAVTKVVSMPGLPVTFVTEAGVVVPPVVSVNGTPVTTGTEYEHGVGSAYAGFTVTASGGAAPYTYSIISGTLPPGITLNSSSGAVSGTPGFQSAGTYAGIVIRATDAGSQYGQLAPFTLTIAFKDPYYANVSLLLDYDAADGNTVFTDQKSGSNMSVIATAEHDTGVTPLYGTSSFLFSGGGRLLFSDSPLWNLAASNFTIDFTVRPATLTGTQAWLGQWQAAPNLGWVVSQGTNTVAMNVSTDGTTNLSDLVSPAATLAANTWSRWRIDFNGSKYRLYKDGAMVASSTTLRAINNSSLNLAVANTSVTSGLPFTGNARGIRLTLGTARTASDSGYTISNRAFPTS